MHRPRLFPGVSNFAMTLGLDAMRVFGVRAHQLPDDLAKPEPKDAPDHTSARGDKKRRRRREMREALKSNPADRLTGWERTQWQRKRAAERMAGRKTKAKPEDFIGIAKQRFRDRVGGSLPCR